MKITGIVLIPLLAFLTFSCGQKHQDKNTIAEPVGSALATDSNVIKLYVENSGIISVDGQPVTLSELDSSMKNLKSKNGVVYYSRDNINADPTQESMKVMEIIIDYEMPMKFFTDKTFTEPVKLK